MTSMAYRQPPSLQATLYTEQLSAEYLAESLRVRGYYRNGEPWAVVDVGGVKLTAHKGEGLAGMLRLADALRDAVALARQAEQDAALAAATVRAGA